MPAQRIQRKTPRFQEAQRGPGRAQDTLSALHKGKTNPHTAGTNPNVGKYWYGVEDFESQTFIMCSEVPAPNVEYS